MKLVANRRIAKRQNIIDDMLMLQTKFETAITTASKYKVE